ncbi:acyl-CoA dehydrogenase family protein [Actinacidiphila bryophytorum]|uniref:Acyl-CoA dehydrogenase AidB n=1 Tax=Actinacidiphila bryophytorum TaxID=1436133 RepID=A0A9W4H6A8_9ACTN|nr:acyl-CoA dehydrogenase family protein [Actinacidiphila bryophytorum]MBM9436665.1 acyl-CoA dehydrogenase family protein [Actinacidiphila bryophytorum]MBN6547878.1 acyl-CoA dehydrogenase family protein [Actinacidiphila bryophytorum]CAG7653919.1 Putative acyl-CoA dehydrogenase AidB [Actinacidiphila bryophytorum]
MTAPTHTVTNQVPPLVGHDVYRTDSALTDAVARHADPALLPEIDEELSLLGVAAGSAQAQRWGEEANTYGPVLRTHDRYGNRIDEVDFHPSWHRLLGHAVTAGLTDAWSRPDGHLRRAAGFLVWSQVEAGHGCPVSMTHAAVPALRTDPVLAAEWEPRLGSHVYDPRLVPAGQKPGALLGMGMTEKQGGSDVRANTTAARPLAEEGAYALTGHKWFCSAPMSDGFLVLAQAPGGLTCFLLPRVLPDGTRNTFAIQRLKDKLGNRSNASSEVEFRDTWARRVGEEGRGVATIIEMVAATRLDCAIGSAALMRQAVAQAVHHARHRSAFGGPLVDKPLMRNVLADLALESEAATTTVLRLAAACDTDTEQERHFRRLAVAVTKFWVTKRCPAVAAEALECLGGNGYVEESGMPRIFRESPLNSVWEGSGNVQALDVLRVLTREPLAVNAFLSEVGLARGADRRLDAAVKDLLSELGDLDGVEGRARRIVERMALVLQGSLLVRHAPAEVADAFCASRLGGEWGSTFGTLPSGLALPSILTRTTPWPGAS